ncbi:hypothetical protein V1264_011516 [Littorina saxatilis]|uniref:Uncharacterized protein n=1 Tax=Littorina saxatilis TaxID=31220 RepID=A0AAN9BT06_9CAEN
MEASRPLMTLSIARVMSLLFLLPLLFAHRPISIHPRASVLRRMPIFYGKRDPSLASPTFFSVSSPRRPVSTHDSRPSFDPPRGDQSPGFTEDSNHSPRNPARTRFASRRKLFKTKHRQFPDELRSSGDLTDHQNLAIPSVLYKKLQNYIQREEGAPAKPLANYASNVGRRTDSVKPEFHRSPISSASNRADYVEGNQNPHDDFSHRNGLRIQLQGLVHDDNRQRFIRRIEAARNTQGYERGHVQGQIPGQSQGQSQVMPFAQEQNAMVPFKLGSAADGDESKYVRYAFANMLNNVIEDEKYDIDNDDDDDGSRIKSRYSTTVERTNDW